MTDRFISQLPADANDANVRAGDLVVVSRGGTDYKALTNGNRFVPAATAAENGKFLGVDASGTPGWRETTTTPTLTQLWSGTQRATEGEASFYIDTGRSFADYDDIVFRMEFRSNNTGSGADPYVDFSETIPVPVLQSSIAKRMFAERTTMTIRIEGSRQVFIRGQRYNPNEVVDAFHYINVFLIYGLKRGY